MMGMATMTGEKAFQPFVIPTRNKTITIKARRANSRIQAELQAPTRPSQIDSPPSEACTLQVRPPPLQVAHTRQAHSILTKPTLNLQHPTKHPTTLSPKAA